MRRFYREDQKIFEAMLAGEELAFWRQASCQASIFGESGRSHTPRNTAVDLI
jgi:hypothetical protein